VLKGVGLGVEELLVSVRAAVLLAGPSGSALEVLDF
jgi:hypothetical protein